MSDGFDDLLSGVIDSAANAAHEPGAAAARKRGRQRRGRQRVAASVLSLAVLGAVGGVAAANLPGGSKGVAAATGTGTPAPVTPSPYSPSPMATPSGSTASPAGSTTSKAPTSSSPATVGASTGTATVDPDRYVAAAWLGASQMPLYTANVTVWQVDSNSAGTRIGGEVFADPASQADVACTDSGAGSLSGLQSGLLGDQIQNFTGANSDQAWSSGVIPGYTWQSALFYQNATDAARAMSGLTAGFAACKTEVTGVDPSTGVKLVGSTQQTLDQSTAQCWSVLAVPATGQDPGTLDHDCFVRSGDMIEEVNVEVHEVPSLTTLSFADTDASVVTELQTALGAYPGNS